MMTKVEKHLENETENEDGDMQLKPKKGENWRWLSYDDLMKEMTAAKKKTAGKKK